MFITKKHVSRRTVLRGALGAAVGLPFLDAMVPALTAQSKTAAAAPLRFGVAYIPNGITPDQWHPEKPGTEFDFKPIMKPMEVHKNRIVTVSRLFAVPGSIHLGASSAFLNGTGPAGGKGDLTALVSKKSVDQHIADAIGGDAPLRSLEIATGDIGTSGGACDGYPCMFYNAMAWRDDTTPLPVAINPRMVFERMFGDVGSVEERRMALKTKKNLADAILGEANQMKKTLGKSDNILLDGYLSNIRDVEQQLVRLESRVDQTTADAPAGIPDTFEEHLTLQYGLMRLAFQADVTRVVSYLLDHEGSGRSYGFIGVPENHHAVSHHGNNPETLVKYNKISTYHITKLSEFVTSLAQTPDGDGSLLDHTLLYFGCGMGNGNGHDRRNPPAMLIGGANGRLKGGRHLVAQGANDEEPTANLLLAIAHMAGADIKSIGRSTRVFPL